MTSSSKGPRTDWLLRLHSAAGVGPATAFFVLHLWINARAMQGRRSYEAVVRVLQALPGRVFVELLFIAAPLLFHAGYGLLVILGRAPEPLEPPKMPPWSRPMQRATGVATLAFIVFHLAAIRVPAILGDVEPTDFYPLLTAELSATTTVGVPAWSAAYLLGLAAVSYHLANGLSRCCLRLGIGESRGGRRAVLLGTSFGGAALFLLGASTVAYFATGASLLDAILATR